MRPGARGAWTCPTESVKLAASRRQCIKRAVSNMSHPQSVMYEQEMSEIQEVTDRLHQDARARTILIVDKNGSLIASSGVDANLDTTSLSSLVAGNVAAIGGMAKLIEEEEFSGQFHEGKDI